MAKLLFLCKRSRPNPDSSGLSHIKLYGPEQDDYKKLSHVIKYVWGTLYNSLKLSLHCTDEAGWWVDASFATHHNMRSHKANVMMFGGGAGYSTSIQQKCQYKFSTEAEFFGVYDIMGQISWTHALLEEQGHKESQNFISRQQKCDIVSREW